MSDVDRNVRHYMALPYTIVLRRDEEGDCIAQVQELEGCIAHGPTEQEALESLKEAQGLWISDRLERGYPVPEPIEEEILPSGKWLQRVPRSLHRKLSILAKREGVSLNALATSVLSKAVGVREAKERVGTPHPDIDIYNAMLKSWELAANEPELEWQWSIFQPQGGFSARTQFKVDEVLRLLNISYSGHMTSKLEELEDTYEKEKTHQVKQ